MIALICTTEPSRIEWLPQFVRHYRSRGVERFFLSLQIEPDLDPALREGYRAQFEQTLAALGIRQSFFLEKSFDAFAIRDHHDAIQDAYISPGDWIVWCDSDEFQSYPLPLPKMIERWEASGHSYVKGLMLDRVAADGGLPRFDPMTSVWEQFPLICLFAIDVGKSLIRKVTVARGDVFLCRGNHFLARGAPAMLTEAARKRLAAVPARDLTCPDAWMQIHHFKWDASVLDRLRFRLSPQWRAKCPWWTESDKLLDYFEARGGHFDLNDLKLLDVPKDLMLIIDDKVSKEVDVAEAEAMVRAQPA
jgi:hypothetical protein